MVMPRDGSYEPYARIAGDDQLLHVRFIEGPPRVLPGEAARVVLQVDDEASGLYPGAELELLENGDRRVGLITVSRLVSSTIPTV